MTGRSRPRQEPQQEPLPHHRKAVSVTVYGDGKGANNLVDEAEHTPLEQRLCVDPVPKVWRKAAKERRLPVVPHLVKADAAST